MIIMAKITAAITLLVISLVMVNVWFMHGSNAVFRLKTHDDDNSELRISDEKKILDGLEQTGRDQNVKLDKIIAVLENSQPDVFPKTPKQFANSQNIKSPPTTKKPDPYKCMDCLLKLPARDHITDIPEAEKNHPLTTYSQRRDYPVLISKPDLDDNYPKSTKLVKVLFAIKSICQSHDRREAVRHTWASSAFNHLHTNYASSIVFLLGACKTQEDQRKVEQEDFYTKDIIQWDFHDSFTNLTVKECLFLQYSKRNLTVVTHIFKGDDDVFVNPIALGKVISNQIDQDDIFLGSSMGRAPRITDVNNRYFVPKILYPHDKYPPYVSGGGYIMSKVITDKLFEASLKNWIFPIDDAFVGVLLNTVNKMPGEYHYFRSWGNDFNGDMETGCFWHEEILTFHKVTPEQMIRYWSLFFGSLGTCSKGDRG